MTRPLVKIPLPGWLFLAVLCLIVIPPLKASSSELDELLGLVDERLQLMKDVAAHKFVNRIEIENSEREAHVLRRAMLSAQQVGLKPTTVEAFFRVQILQAKAVQNGWVEHWRTASEDTLSDTAIPDLSEVIRPKLLDLGEHIVEQLPRALPQLHDINQFESNFRKVDQAINSRFISKEMKRQLLRALVRIQAQNLG